MVQVKSDLDVFGALLLSYPGVKSLSVPGVRIHTLQPPSYDEITQIERPAPNLRCKQNGELEICDQCSTGLS